MEPEPAKMIAHVIYRLLGALSLVLVQLLMEHVIQTINANTVIFHKVPLLGQAFLRERSVLVIA